MNDPTDGFGEFNETFNGNNNDIPEGIARMRAMDHAMEMWQPGEGTDDILARAAKFYDFLVDFKQRPYLHRGATN